MRVAASSNEHVSLESMLEPESVIPAAVNRRESTDPGYSDN
jgi:hypothetical protein